MSVLRNVSDVSVKNLTNLIYSSILSILFPEWLFNMRNSINTNTIEVKFLYSVLNPVEQSLSNPLIVLIKIR